MKYLLICSFFTCSLNTFAQDQVLNDSQIIDLFQEINKTDGSNINNPKVRQQIFYKNFDTIIKIIEGQGFPYLSNQEYKKKTIQSIKIGAQRTFIHILQTQPKLLLNKEIISLLKTEVENNRLDSSLLKIVLQTFQYDTDINPEIAPIWSSEVEDNFYLAFREWNIKLYPE